MGLIVKKNVVNDCLLGIWEIQESLDVLLGKLNLTEEEYNVLNSFQSYQRKLEWLSVRVLINEILEKECLIVYNADRKPFLSDNSHNISISHSHNLTSVMVSSNRKVGIDLEYMSHKIHNISHKFINDDEVITPDALKERLHLYIHWCAKEALYKICDKQDINFKQNLTIVPFDVSQEGDITGFVHNKFGNERFELKYFTIDGYVVVYCTK
jgi:4'-phosphopantetheinyl transferase EntD